MSQDAEDLEGLLDELDQCVDTETRQIRVEEILDAVGMRSFAPLLLLVGLVIASPLSGIPVLPTFSAFIVLLVSLQMLAGRNSFWLPAWMLKRHVDRNRMAKAIDWLRPPSRFVDRLIKPRLSLLVTGQMTRVIAMLCLFIAACMPFLELVPFSSSVAGVALAAFGLSLISGDGLIALIAYLTTGAVLCLAVYGLVL